MVAANNKSSSISTQRFWSFEKINKPAWMLFFFLGRKRSAGVTVYGWAGLMYLSLPSSSSSWIRFFNSSSSRASRSEEKSELAKSVSHGYYPTMRINQRRGGGGGRPSLVCCCDATASSPFVSPSNRLGRTPFFFFLFFFQFETFLLFSCNSARCSSSPGMNSSSSK